MSNPINRRPNWSNISADRANGIHDRWRNAINRSGIEQDRSASNRWSRWSEGIRDNWRDYGRGYANGWFDRRWWDRHQDDGCHGWHYAYYSGYDSYPYSYWYSSSSWDRITRWVYYTSDSRHSQPVYYSYGDGGNVTYQDNRVYVYGEQVASADEYAESAAELATVPPPANEGEAQKAEWLPLGTFAVSTTEKDTQPSRVIQLAVNKQGIIAGTLYNTQTDQAVAVQGKVDTSTQRVALRIAGNENIVIETGLYNLTCDEVPLLVHFGKDRVETYLLVRITAPKETPATQPSI